MQLCIRVPSTCQLEGRAQTAMPHSQRWKLWASMWKAYPRHQNTAPCYKMHWPQEAAHQILSSSRLPFRQAIIAAAKSGVLLALSKLPPFVSAKSRWGRKHHVKCNIAQWTSTTGACTQVYKVCEMYKENFKLHLRASVNASWIFHSEVWSEALRSPDA